MAKIKGKIDVYVNDVKIETSVLKSLLNKWFMFRYRLNKKR